MTSTALSVIPQGASLVEIEPKVAAWIDQEDDGAILRLARDRLAAWRHHAEAGSAERDSAIRLDIRCERRLGQLPEAAPKPQGQRSDLLPGVTGSPTAERVALSRARALAAIPREVFEEVIAEPKPSREKLLAAAIIPSPTVDPVAVESARVHQLLRGPARGSWANEFDVPMLNEKAVLTIRETQESWLRWCERWDTALADVPAMRRIK